MDKLYTINDIKELTGLSKSKLISIIKESNTDAITFGYSQVARWRWTEEQYSKVLSYYMTRKD